MRFGDTFSLSTRMFKAHTMRTALTIAGMGVGIGAVLFLVSLGYGLQFTLLDRITTTEALLTMDVRAQRESGIVLNDVTIQQIQSIGGVDNVSPVLEVALRTHIDTLSADLPGVIIQKGYFDVSGTKMVAGSAVSAGDHGVVVDRGVATVFGYGERLGEFIGQSIVVRVPINDVNGTILDSEKDIKTNERLTYKEQAYRIIGVTDAAEGIVYVYRNSVAQYGINAYTSAKVHAKDSEVFEEVRQVIVDGGLSVSSLSETVDQANKVFRTIRFILMFFGIIALAISAIGMLNTMTISLLERTSEIGIMKSIGATDQSILAIFMMESTIMGFLGSLSGVLLGLIGGEVMNLLTNFIAMQFGGESVDLFQSPVWFVIAIIIFGTLVGTGTGFFPARQASRIDPLEALRYK